MINVADKLLQLAVVLRCNGFNLMQQMFERFKVVGKILLPRYMVYVLNGYLAFLAANKHIRLAVVGIEVHVIILNLNVCFVICSMLSCHLINNANGR